MFKENCEPHKKLTYIRHVFFTRNQWKVEPIDNYLTNLRNKAQPCEFEPLSDGLIRDRIVCGIKDEVCRARILRESDLTLKKQSTYAELKKWVQNSWNPWKDQKNKQLRQYGSLLAVRNSARQRTQNELKIKGRKVLQGSPVVIVAENIWLVSVLLMAKPVTVAIRRTILRNTAFRNRTNLQWKFTLLEYHMT